nr:hypothetical protein [Clostridia bacterium]
MGLLIKTLMLAAAGAAGWMLAKRKSGQEKPAGETVIYLGEDDAVIDPERPPVAATVKSCVRRMDPLSLNSGNEAVFILADGTELRLNFSGEGGLYLKTGDQGQLTWRGMRLLRFEREDGAVFGGMFYAPGGEEAADE